MQFLNRRKSKYQTSKTISLKICETSIHFAIYSFAFTLLMRRDLKVETMEDQFYSSRLWISLAVHKSGAICAKSRLYNRKCYVTSLQCNHTLNTYKKKVKNRLANLTGSTFYISKCDRKIQIFVILEYSKAAVLPLLPADPELFTLWPGSASGFSRIKRLSLPPGSVTKEPNV